MIAIRIPTVNFLMSVSLSVHVENLVLTGEISFYCDSRAPSGARPPHYGGFKIILRHTTLGRTPLEE
jgi:hypothetical protein